MGGRPGERVTWGGGTFLKASLGLGGTGEEGVPGEIRGDTWSKKSGGDLGGGSGEATPKNKKAA